LFLYRAEPAPVRDKNKKTGQTPKADAGILTWAVTKIDHEIIIHSLQQEYR